MKEDKVSLTLEEALVMYCEVSIVSNDADPLGDPSAAGDGKTLTSVHA